MRSSTSHHGLLNTRLFGTLMLGIVGAPLLWLITEETGYALAYQACDARSNSWVIVPTAAAIALAVVVGAITVGAQRRAERERIPLPFVGWLAIGMAWLMVLVLAASAIAPIILHPCD
jgi:hypothetical protein